MIAIALVVAANLGVRWPDDVQRRLDTERAVLVELNRARTSPTALAATLRQERGYYRGNLLVRPGAEAAILTEEGVAPVDEAIAYVAHESVEAPLAPAPLLAAAAADHQADQGGSGMVGHVGRDGSTPADRLRRRGGDGYVGEVIAYGSEDPAGIVRQLIVDDGVADRGHRRLLYDPSLRYAGVSCGTHPVYRYMCVVTLGRTPDGQPLRSGMAQSLRGGTGRRS
jgi:uncharacterized protein YkwD